MNEAILNKLLDQHQQIIDAVLGAEVKTSNVEQPNIAEVKTSNVEQLNIAEVKTSNVEQLNIAEVKEEKPTVTIDDVKALKYFIKDTNAGKNNRPAISHITAESKRCIVDFIIKINVLQAESKVSGTFGPHLFIKDLTATKKHNNVFKKQYSVTWFDNEPEKWLEENGQYIEHALNNNLHGEAFMRWWPRRKPQPKAPYKLDKVGDSYYFIGKQMWPMLGAEDTPENKKLVENALAYCQITDNNLKVAMTCKARGIFFTTQCVFLKNVNPVFGQTVMNYGTSLQSFDKNISQYPDTKLPSPLSVKPYIPH